MRDPLQNDHVTLAKEIIDGDSVLFGAYLFVVYVRFVRRMVQKSDAFFNCRVDTDWQRLNMDVGTFIYMLDASMEDALQNVKRNRTQIGNREKFVEKMIGVLSRLFILNVRYSNVLGSTSGADKLTLSGRRKYYNEDDFNVRLRNHYKPLHVCCESEFTWILNRWHAEITMNSRVWTFWKNIETE